MLLVLQITLTILCAICVAAVIPASVWGGWPWLTPFVACGSLFFLLMLFCKKAREKKEQTEEVSPPAEEKDTTEKKE